MNDLEISVIISTYNSKKWLKHVLTGYNCQTLYNFEIVIADDGSKDDTKEMIEAFKLEAHFPITHVWHEDDGFQKSKILNKAILACKTNYIIMSDGDCIPRKDFIDTHYKHREPGYFLSGGYYKLTMPISNKINKEIINNQTCFNLKWLLQNGLKRSFKNNKLNSFGNKEKFLNWITPTKATWNGHNASGWKEDIIKVNGFDERMQYGGQDRELGERLVNLGIQSKQIRYSAIVIHLDHPRGYMNKKSWTINNNIRKNTRKNKVQFTPFGIKKTKK